ncbi:MAG: hypothetical protein ACP5JO_00630 [Candidatus Ratteibacteria bacterium]
MKKFLLIALFLCEFQVHAIADGAAHQGLEDFLSGKDLKMQRSFMNNMIAIGKNLEFSGTSYEDVILFGITINFKGTSDKDIYIAGDTVRMSGRIKGNLKVMARNLIVENCEVDGNVNILSPEILITDSVKCKNITKIWSRNIQMGGQYKTVYIKTRDVIFTKNIDVKDLFVQSQMKPSLPINVLKHCNFTYEPPVPQKAQIFFSSKFRKIYSFLSLCFPFLLMTLITPRILQETIEMIEKKPVWIFFSGVLLLLITPLIMILLMITVIGAPVGLILLTFYISLLYLCRGFTCIALGRIILFKMKESKMKMLLAIFVGTGVFVLITAIPKAGVIGQLPFLIFGFGGFAVGRIRMFLTLRKQNLI